MPSWRVEFHPAAVRDLRKLGVDGERRVLRYMRERIVCSEDPRRFGDAALGERREEQYDGHREHQHLRAQSGAATIGNEHAPRRGEAEQRVIEDEPKSAAEEKQCPLTLGIGVRQCQRAGRQQSRGESHRRRIDLRNCAAIVREQPGVDGKISHEASRLSQQPRAHKPRAELLLIRTVLP